MQKRSTRSFKLQTKGSDINEVLAVGGTGESDLLKVLIYLIDALIVMIIVIVSD